jgi:hypothetical protein
VILSVLRSIDGETPVDWYHPGEACPEGIAVFKRFDGWGMVCCGAGASSSAAWRNVRDVFADPMGAAGLRRVADTQTDGARSYADYADMLLGIGSARAAEPDEEEQRSEPDDPARDPAEELRWIRFNPHFPDDIGFSCTSSQNLS